MTQQPLTPAGVQAKQNELYALPANQLAQQVSLIQSDFKNWVSTNFILTQAQSAYLNTIDSRWIAATASNTATAVSNMLPITLNANTPPPSYISKMVKHSYVMDTAFDSQAGFTVSGSLTFYIVYTT